MCQKSVPVIATAISNEWALNLPADHPCYATRDDNTGQKEEEEEEEEEKEGREGGEGGGGVYQTNKKTAHRCCTTAKL